MALAASFRPIILQEIDTPALLVDADRLDRNLCYMAAVARDSGVELRPHAKTHKSVEIAQRQLHLGAVGMTVAKPQEALVFWRAGFRSIFLAYSPVGPLKLAAIEPLLADGVLTVGLDSLEAAQPLSELAGRLDLTIPVLFEVDVGMKRAGVCWGEPAAALAGRIGRLPGLELRGIFCHEGQAHQYARDELAAFAAEVAQRMSATAELLRAAGFACPVVSVGSTLTASYMRGDAGITEIRPGTYVFNDIRTMQSGVCRMDDCALTILATVVSRPEPGRAVIDAGSKVFTTLAEEPYGYGAVLSVPGATLARLSEEHGVIELADPSVDLQIGDRLRIIPIHVCVTVNMQRELYEVRGNVLLHRLEVDAHLCSR